VGVTQRARPEALFCSRPDTRAGIGWADLRRTGFTTFYPGDLTQSASWNTQVRQVTVLRSTHLLSHPTPAALRSGARKRPDDFVFFLSVKACAH